MARKKVQLRYIADAAARKASLKKRRQGLLKKVQELSILCGVQACAVVYSEDRIEQPVHWPEDRAEMDTVLQRFQACPEMERRKKMVTKDDYVRQRTEKYKEQAKRLQSSIHEMEMLHLMQLIHVDGRPHGEFTTSELRRLNVFMNEKVRELERKADVLVKAAHVAPPTPPRPADGVPPLNPPAVASSPVGDFQGFVEMLQQNALPSGSIVPEQVLLPYPHQSGGTILGFPVRNFEVGGGSGTANDQDGTLLPLGPRPTIAGGIGNDPSSTLGAIFPYRAATIGNVGGYTANPYEWSNIGSSGSNMESVGAIGEEYLNVGPYMGQPRLDSNTGQFGSIGDVVRGYINVGEYLAPSQGYVGGIPTLQNPVLGGNIHGGYGYNVEALPENIPFGSFTVSIAPGSLTPDVDGSNQGRNNGLRDYDPRTRGF